MLRPILLISLVGVISLVGPTVPVPASNLSFSSSLDLSKNPLSCPATCSSLPRIATVNSRVYVTWLNNTSENSNLLFTSSNNNGSSFGPIIKITNSTTGNADDQQISAVGSNVYIVWQQNVSLSSSNIFFRASTSNGTSFGPIINVSAGISGLSSSSVPDIAAAGNNVYVLWLATTTKSVNEILFKASATNGSNLATAPALTLSTNAYGSAITCTQVTCDAIPHVSSSGTSVYAAWSDLSPGRPQTFFASSTNSGTSFGTSHSLSSTPTGENDVYQEIASTGTSVYVTWTNDTINSDNTMFAGSINSGGSFGAALNLNKAVVTDLNPELAASGTNVYVVWSDASGGNTEVLYRSSNNNGVSFGGALNLSNVAGTSNQQMIATSSTNVYVTWLESGPSNNGVYFVSSSDSGSTFGTPLNLSNDSVSNDPLVAGSGGYAYVVWEDDTTGNGDIYFNRGSPFSPPTVVSESVGVIENQSQVITLTGNDPAGLSLTFSIVTGPSHGTLGAVSSTGPNSAEVTYTPNSNYTGPDNFSYKATSGSQTSSPATVSITIFAPFVAWSGGGGRHPVEM